MPVDRRGPAEARGLVGAGDGRAQRVGVGTTILKTAGDRPASITLEPRQGTLSADWLEVLAVSLADLLRVRVDPDDRLRERRQPAARACGLAPTGDRDQIVARRVTPANHPSTADGEPHPCARVCGMRFRRFPDLPGRCLYAATTTMPGEIAEQVNFGVPSADWRVLVFLMAGAIVSTVSFGLVPALQATRVELVRATRGEVTRDARPGRARHALIAVQVGASALLLICAAVFLRSAFAAALADPGIRTSDTIRVPIANEPRRAAIVREVTAHPSVVAVAARRRRAGGGFRLR